MPSDSNVLHPLREGPASSTSLLRALQLPRPALARALQSLQREGEVLKVGATRGTRYALPRVIAGAGSSWPVFQVDTAGRVQEFGRLDALMPRHFHFESKRPALRGLSDALPWFLPRCADDAHFAWLTRQGWDCPGDLIIGAEAREAHRHAIATRRAISASERSAQYPRLAEAALEQGPAFAQLPGTQPKFTVLADHGGHLAHALVKFSPPLSTATGLRWGDLLVAEHLAHGYLNARGVCAVHSRVYRFGGRIFLEIDRFDRVGAEGRRGVTALQSLELPRAGEPYGNAFAAEHLAGAGVLPKNDARQIRLTESFSRLIGSTGHEPDHLTLFNRHDGGFALAPAYDLSPALFAPGDEDLAQVKFDPPQPAPIVCDVWPHARRLAEGYWERLVAEPQLSAGFRADCAAALAALRAAPLPPAASAG